nr:YjbF family lipoprotein [Solimonas marina]
MAIQTIRGGYERRDRYPLTKADIERIPYSTLGFWVGRGMRIIVVMKTLTPPYTAVWESTDRAHLTTQNGVITQTSGMPTDLIGYEFPELPVMTLDALSAIAKRPLSGTIRTSERTNAVSAIESTFTLGAAERITILDDDYDVIPVREQLKVPSRHWQAENRYWIRESDDLIIKGQRAFAPQFPAMNWERFPNPKKS